MDQAARQELILSNQPLVFFIAKKYHVPGLPLSDLVQEGNIGLMKAAENFDPAKGKFGTYAFWWIKSYILKAIKENCLVRVPSRRRGANPQAKEDAPFCRVVELEDSATVSSEGDHDPFEAASRNETKQGVQRMLRELTSRERELVCLRFGIGDSGEDHTLQEIARSAGVSAESVRQVINKALAKLRKRNIAGEDCSPGVTGNAEFRAYS
jgi:RNA polymerase sigma factor (sigma-70 family)